MRNAEKKLVFLLTLSALNLELSAYSDFELKIASILELSALSLNYDLNHQNELTN
jgi:hypothetical protein